MTNYPAIYLYRRVVKAKLFIDKNYFRPLLLNDIAGEAFISRFHFSRLFKKIYGSTPHQYLTRVRINHARLLLENNMSVSQACYDVGFESTTSFTALFFRYTGSKPSAYRTKYFEMSKRLQLQPLGFIPNCFVTSGK